MTLLEFSLFLVVVYNFVLVGFIRLKSHAGQAGVAFARYILATTAWTICVALVQLFPQRTIDLWLIRGAHVSAVLIVTCWLWFCVQFPRKSDSFTKTTWWLTISGLPWLILCWTHWLIPAVTLPDVTAGAAVQPVIGPLMIPYTLWIVIGMGAGVIHLMWKLRILRGLERLQIRYILLGSVGLVVAGSIPNLILPLITHSFRFAPYSPLASVFIFTTTTYAIVRYRLMDIKIVLRAGMVYSVTIGVLSLLLALLVPMLNDSLSHYFKLPAATGSIVMALVVALAFQPLRRYVQAQVDLRFFKSVYDYRLTLREAGSALASVRDQDQLVATLVSALVRTLRPRGVAVYLPGNIGELVRVSMIGDLESSPRSYAELDAVPVYAMQADEVLLTEELIRQPEPQRTIGCRLMPSGIYVLLPLVAGDRLCGMVALGEKLSGDVYTADDVGLLRILGKQAAIALDNSRHYQEMVLLNEYHERLLHSLQEGVIAVDPQQRLITINPAGERITGVTAEHALGKRLDDIGITQFPLIDTGEHATEILLKMQSGQEIPVLVTVTSFRRRWDTSDSHLIAFRDLSALRALEQEKLQAQRFSSMGAMAASLAHEIKNPLVPIQMFAHLLPTKYDDAEFRQEFSVTVVNEVERINRLVGQMLDLVRKPSHDQGPVDLREVIDRLLVISRTECERNNVREHISYAMERPFVIGVAGQLYQAVLNVVMNAIQAMPNGGELNISVDEVDDQICCRITDTGPGVHPALLARLFEPLYTTKEGGHGLGLALTYQFVRSNGGEIRAESPPGAGLTVTMLLPIWRRAEAELLCT